MERWTSKRTPTPVLPPIDAQTITAMKSTLFRSFPFYYYYQLFSLPHYMTKDPRKRNRINRMFGARLSAKY